MLLWCDDDGDPALQMQRDVALLERTLREGPLLRVYRFRPHGITLGHVSRDILTGEIWQFRARPLV